MKQIWEYKVSGLGAVEPGATSEEVLFKIEEELDKLGSECWELVTLMPTAAIFKRPRLVP